MKILRQQGTLLIIAVLTLGTLMLLGAYFLIFNLTESRISKSQKTALQTYYLAEAGINEAIWKLKNDAEWSNNFSATSTCEDWETSFTRDPAIFPNGSYMVTIKNSSCANGVITATSTFNLQGGKAQRVVKVKVFKPKNSPVSEYSVFTGGPSENINIRFTDPLTIHSGDLFSNNNLNIKNSSKVYLDGVRKALAGGNIILSGASELNATSCASNMCDPGCVAASECPPGVIGMPQIDFDSPDPNSYFEKAKISDCSLIRTDGKINCVFTLQEFEKLMWDNYPALSLPSSTVAYVTGDVNIRAGQELTVNGVLASDRDFNIGENNCWNSVDPPFLRCGFSRLSVYRPGLPEDDEPSGILAKRKINMGAFSGFGAHALYIEGLIYSGDETSFSNAQAPIEIHGGIAMRKLRFSSLWNNVNIYLDSDVIIDTFSNSSYSPVITVDHWEEEY